LLELNGADTLALQQLRGIGPYWARRIARQRDLLGGFFNADQLLEMKGFTDSMLLKIKPQIWLDTSIIRKIAINSISDIDLQKHPYCWYGVGKSIVNYRAKHGPFKEAGDLRKIIAIRPEQLERLLPYLLFE
jgi:competence protein ComEA